MSKKITPVTLGGKKIDVPGATSHDHGLRMQRERFLLNIEKSEREKNESNLSMASKFAAGMRRLTNSNSTLVLRFGQ